MGYDSLKGKVDNYTKDKTEWQEEFELLSEEQRKVQDITLESNHLDDEILGTLDVVKDEFDLENQLLEVREAELESVKNELSDFVQKELEKLDETQGKLEALHGKKYTGGIEKASGKAKDYISQLEEMLGQLGEAVSTYRSGSDGSVGEGAAIGDTGLLARKAQDNVKTSMSRYPTLLGNHSIEDDLKATNPNYSHTDPDSPWNNNCQRCVAVYEARRRGYDATAQPLSDENDPLMIMNHPNGWPKIFRGGKLEDCSGNSGTQGRQNVEDLAASWGENGRGIVRVRWRMGGGHVFIVERVNGITRFVDPQSGEADASAHFNFAKGSDMFCMRIDNLDFSDSIHKCCQ